MSRWIPLESNPEVFNAWTNQAGLVSSSAQFHDLYGLDPELLSKIPRPVKAVILVFPYREALARRNAEDERIAKEGGPKVDGSVFWMKQTIHNACGTMALIHALANSDVTLSPSSPIEKFFNECRHKSSLERAKLLETTPLFGDIHAAVATKGQSEVPEPEVDVDGAYTCFISVPALVGRGENASGGIAVDATGDGSTARRVIELDGARAGPVDRGECTDLLEDVARIVKEDFIKQSDSVSFSLMYLGQSM